MPDRKAYDRQAAVSYAHAWAYRRNPEYYDYEDLGGDCTNFVSQCLYAGSGIMDYTPDFGWYYIDPNNKAPAWSGVEYLYRYLTRDTPAPGPFGVSVRLWQLQPGDVVQLSPDGARFTHTAIVVRVGNWPSQRNVLLAAHSYDADYRPLSTYAFQSARYLHISGVWTGSQTPEPQ